MKIEQKKISEIQAYQQNAKKHPADQIHKIANSIKNFGFNQPVVIDKNGIIVVGHGRYLAALELGYSEVPCLLIETLTEGEINAYRLADNRTNESEWDMELVIPELQKLETSLQNLTGFDLSRLLMMEQTDSDLDIDKEKAFEEYVTLTVKRLLIAGFPYRTKNDQELINSFYKLVLTKNKLSQAGYSIAMELHDGIWKTVSGSNKKAPFENWNQKILTKVLTFQNPTRKPLPLYTIRALSSIMNGMQKPSQFKPALAKYFYNEYTKEGDFIVDPSAGWGGRMLGYISLQRTQGKFIATDPSPDSNTGNRAILKLLQKQDSGVQLIQSPFEDWDAKEYYGQVDFMLTSPPYFDTEEYAGTESSFRRYPSIAKWLGFLQVYVEKCHKLLKPGKTFVLNIDKVGKDRVDIESQLLEFLKVFTKVEITREYVAHGVGGTRQGEEGEKFYICTK